MIKKIDVYIIKKFLGTFFYALSMLILVVIIFDFSEKIDDFIQKQAPFREIIFNYYFNFIPYFVNLFAYLFTFISVIFFTSRMASNTEIVAILSSGVSFARLLRPYMISAVFLAVFSFVLANFVIPHTNKNLLEFEFTYLKNPRANKDINIHIQTGPETYFYIEKYRAQSYTGLRPSIEKINDDGLYYKLIGNKIIWDSIQENWIIDQYTLREIYDKKEVISRGDSLMVDIDLLPQDLIINIEDVKTMNFFYLNNFIRKEKMKGSKQVTRFIIEKHKRIADPFATIILTLIGVSLSSRKVRGGIGMHLGIGITITFAYILFMQIATVFATVGSLHPFIAVWIPNLFFGIISVFLIRLAPK